MSLVNTLDCKDADDFLDLLAPRGELFGGQESVGSQRSGRDAWLYRGHSDDRYVLLPSALRDCDSFAAFGRIECVTNISQVRAEVQTLRRFFDLSDATGLTLPEDSQALRGLVRDIQSDDYESRLDSGKEAWPPQHLWSLIGIAQHYGVPTRLLDWSYKSSPAAYFAAQGAIAKLAAAAARTRKILGGTDNHALDSIAQKLKLKLNEAAPSSNSELAIKAAAWAEYNSLLNRNLTVWAFRFGRYADWFGSGRRIQTGTCPPLPIDKVTAPHAQNPNLHAQDGLFTLQQVSLAGKLEKPLDRTPLDTYLESSLVQHDSEHGDVKYFHRIRLRWRHVDHLMWRLSQEGVNAATIYPGYRGVALSLIEERLSYG